MVSNDASNPAVLVRVATEVEAALIVAALAEQGIKAEAVGGAIAGFRAEAPADVAVVVQAGHLEEAQRALSEIREQLSDVDWGSVDVGTPE
jgi:hypothetical protein